MRVCGMDVLNTGRAYPGLQSSGWITWIQVPKFNISTIKSEQTKSWTELQAVVCRTEQPSEC